MKKIILICMIMMLAFVSKSQAVFLKSDTLLGVTDGVLNGDSLVTTVWYLDYKESAENRIISINNRIVTERYRHSTGERYQNIDLHTVYMNEADTVYVGATPYGFYDAVTALSTLGWDIKLTFDELLLDKEGRY